jgi:hypothetical protein
VRITDILVENHGSVVLLNPVSDEGRTWLDNNVAAEGWQWIGDALACEPRMVGAVVEGARNDGLEVA